MCLEGIVRIARATLLVAGVWAHNGANKHDRRGVGQAPWLLIATVVGMQGAWAVHWGWAGGKRDLLLRDELIYVDIAKEGPGIAKRLAIRNSGTITTVGDEAKKETSAAQGLSTDELGQSCRDLKTELEQAAADRDRLNEKRDWTDIGTDRKRLVNDVMAARSDASMLSLLYQYLIRGVDAKNAMVQVAHLLSEDIRRDFRLKSRCAVGV